MSAFDHIRDQRCHMWEHHLHICHVGARHLHIEMSHERASCWLISDLASLMWRGIHTHTHTHIRTYTLSLSHTQTHTHTRTQAQFESASKDFSEAYSISIKISDEVAAARCRSHDTREDISLHYYNVCVGLCVCVWHIELPAKLLDYFLRSNKSNINQHGDISCGTCDIISLMSHTRDMSHVESIICASHIAHHMRCTCAKKKSYMCIASDVRDIISWERFSPHQRSHIRNIMSAPPVQKYDSVTGVEMSEHVSPHQKCDVRHWSRKLGKCETFFCTKVE